MITVRLQFEKTGYAIFYSNLDLQRVFQRGFKKSGLPVWYSQGYNPRIYLTFTLPLSLGHESLCESCDFRLNEEMSEEEILKALQGCLPEGINVYSAKEVTFDSTEITYATYRLTFYGEKGLLDKCINDVMAADEIIVTKTTKKGSKELNLKNDIENFEITEQGDDYVTVSAIFPAGLSYNVNPGLLVDYIAKNYGIDANETGILRVNIMDKNHGILK